MASLVCRIPRLLRIRYFQKDVQSRFFSVESTTTSDGQAPVLRKEKNNKAMKAYLERAKEHDEFMKVQLLEFKVGKRHLANMMGEDPETFTQEDIDRAIEYLFPSGLHDRAARPKMKPPSEVFPQRKAAEFDETGRPNHALFYTGKPNFFKLLFDIVENINNISAFEDRMIRKRGKPDETQKIELSGTEWISKDQLQLILVEQIVDLEYDNFVNAMNRLATLPYSYKAKDFIDKYRKSLMSQTNTYNIPQIQYDPDGRSFITVYECLRKRARADVTLRAPGTGKISINGHDITYFEHLQNREQAKVILCCNTNAGRHKFQMPLKEKITPQLKR